MPSGNLFEEQNSHATLLNTATSAEKCGNCDALQLEAARRRASRYEAYNALSYQILA